METGQSRWSILRRDFGCVKGRAMVIPEARSRVHKGLDDLITGRITNMEFDPVYDEFHCSPDRAVAAIAQFGWGLYSDSVTYRITEHYRISPEAREMANRCLLFLKTDLGYAWPDWPKRSFRFNWLPIVFAVGVISLLLVACTLADATFARFFACGLMFLVLVHQFWVLFFSSRQNSPAWKEFWASGDKDAWPFLRRSEYQDVLQTVTPSQAEFVE